MLVHSLMDDNVHPQNTFHVVRAMIDHGKSIDLKIYPPGGGRAVSPPRLWYVKRHVYTKEELESSVTFEEEKQQEENERERDDERDFR